MKKIDIEATLSGIREAIAASAHLPGQDEVEFACNRDGLEVHMTEQATGMVAVSRPAIIRYLTDQGWRRQTSKDGRLTRLWLEADVTGEAVNLIFSTSAREERSEVAAAIDTIVQLYDTTPNRLTQQLAHLATHQVNDFVTGESAGRGIKIEPVMRDVGDA